MLKFFVLPHSNKAVRNLVIMEKKKINIYIYLDCVSFASLYVPKLASMNTNE